MRIVYLVRQLAIKVEDFKRYGLSPSEASRLHQYSTKFYINLQNLLDIKDFRTPYLVRSFARVYILILPLFYGPYYAEVAHGGYDGGEGGHGDFTRHGTNLLFACCLSAFTSLAQVGLFNAQDGLEDAFRPGEGSEQ